MSLKDYYILCSSANLEEKEIPCVKVEDGTVSRIEICRGLRYKIFEKEDGEFWSAFMQKYIPANQDQKSLTKAIGDVLDAGKFDYQEQWEDKLDERCFVYKSMKYGTRVIFGQKSGTLVLEEYK